MNKESAEFLALALIQEARQNITNGASDKAIWRLIDAAGVLAEVTADPMLTTGRGYRLRLHNVPPAVVTPEYCSKCSKMKKVFEIKFGAILGDNTAEIYGCEHCD